MQFYSPNDDLRHEQEAEWEALPLWCSDKFKQVLEAVGIPPEVVIQHPGAKIITLKGGQFSNESTWGKFLESTNQPSAPRQLVSVAEQLTVQYKRWFLSSFTGRYRVIQAEADLNWLEQVISRAVKRFILLNKYKAYLSQQPVAFANPLVAIGMLLLMKYHELGEEAPRLIHHIVRDPDLLRALLDAYFEEHQQALRQVWPLIYNLRASQPQEMIGPAVEEVGNQAQLGERDEGKPSR